MVFIKWFPLNFPEVFPCELSSMVLCIGSCAPEYELLNIDDSLIDSLSFVRLELPAIVPCI